MLGFTVFDGVAIIQSHGTATDADANGTQPKMANNSEDKRILLYGMCLCTIPGTLDLQKW
jgi:hypothetical protein